TIRRRRPADRASGKSERWIPRCCARTETSDSGNGAAGRADAFGQAHLQQCRSFSACKKDLSPVATGNVVQRRRRTGRKSTGCLPNYSSRVRFCGWQGKQKNTIVRKEWGRRARELRAS